NIEAGKTIVEIHQKIIERQKRDRDFMLSHDKADLTDMNNYDLVIDTTNITAKQAAEQILRAFKH
ncbi:MAG: hypothetical protein NTZ80_04455, partial [Patescibacteria group bacterium]|nr:hypothetical protein [Patescibacteria group bacterium]